MVVKDIESIKRLYDDLRAKREVLNWHEFADKIKYKRPYLSRVLNGHEPLTEELLKAVNDTFCTKAVSRETNVENSTDWKEEYLKLAKEHMELLKQKPGKINLDELKDLVESNSSESLRFLKVNLALLTDLYDHLVKASEKDEALSAKIEEILKED